MTALCPHCKRPLPSALAVSGNIKRRIVNALLDHPDGLTRWELMQHAYRDDPSGGPESPNIINVHANQINGQIEAQGWRMRPVHLGRGALWRLEPVAGTI